LDNLIWKLSFKVFSFPNIQLRWKNKTSLSLLPRKKIISIRLLNVFVRIPVYCQWLIKDTKHRKSDEWKGVGNKHWLVEIIL
jgi:hypothetical protein